MGKVRGLRARVHQAAVRPKGEAAPGPAPPAPEAAPPPASAAGKDWAFINTNIFARTKIDASALVQKLELDVRSVTSVRRGAEAKTVLPKKEKMKLRREQWLQKIEAIKLAEQKHREERRRRATVVVGDLHALRDALPELLGLEASSRRQARSRERESNKPRPSELSRMSTAQRQQLLGPECLRLALSGVQRLRTPPLCPPVPSMLLHWLLPIHSRGARECSQVLWPWGKARLPGRLPRRVMDLKCEEERTRFRELLASPAYRARPLVAIGQTLARQMQLEGGSQL